MEKRHLVGTGFDHALWTRRATYGMSFLLQEARYRLCDWDLCAEISERAFMWDQGLHDEFFDKPGCLVLRLRRHAPRARWHIRKSPTTGLGFVVFVDLPTDTSNQSCINSAGTFALFFLLLVFVRVHSGRSTLLIFEIITGRTDYFFAISIGLATAGLFHSSKTRSMLGRIKNYCFFAFLRFFQ